MKREEVHELWAPDGDRWRPWVKPVLFAALPSPVEASFSQAPRDAPHRDARALFAALERDRPVGYRGGPARDAAVVIDLAGEASVALGVALAEHGFRPVPLFNAVPAPSELHAMVEQRWIMRALVEHAPALRDVPPGGPPCFLLDDNRMAGGHSAPGGVFDNRSRCRLADFPSAETLAAAGIRRFVVIRSGAMQTDLAAVLFDWQNAGITGHRFFRGRLDPITLSAPSRLRRFIEFFRDGGLGERPDGSFGKTVPHGG